MDEKIFNNGHKAEIEAKEILKKLFDNVKKTKSNEFYDYLVKKGNLDIKIEVKYCPIPYKSGYIHFRWNQFKKLVSHGAFLVYFMTDKGNIFLTPRQIMENGHLHYNGKNPTELSVFIRVKINDQGKLKIIQPEHCKFCLGVLGKFI